MSEAQSHVSIRETQGVSVVEFAERKIIEELSIREIEDELIGLVSKTKGIKLLLSFGNVDHLSSAALGMLITLNKKVGEESGQLKLSDITPQIYEVFKITRLNKLFDIHETADHALDSF